MKKTSLMLALGALLYGTSSAYVVADECPLHEGMAPEDVAGFLAALPADILSDDSEEKGWTEAGPLPDGVTLPAGLDPFDKLPANVEVNSDNPIYPRGMCSPSAYEVYAGSLMAEFPVTVTTNIGTDKVNWKKGSPTTGYAVGNGWLIIQSNDTWYLENPWKLYTCGGTTVEKIVLEPMEDKDHDGIRYAFDVGGKFRPADISPDPNDDEHTNDAARGRALTMKVPPRVNFTATYSKPVYVGKAPGYHAGGSGFGEDSTDVSGPDGVPTHDLYGQLTIEFSTPVASATLDPAFRFVADTDCLPVREAKLDSYDANSGIVNLTLLGSGLSYIQESCPGEQPSAIPGATFDVQGRSLVSAVVMPISGCCYSLVDVDTGQNVRLLGVDGAGNGTDEICAP